LFVALILACVLHTTISTFQSKPKTTPNQKKAIFIATLFKIIVSNKINWKSVGVGLEF
jgi:hypothetical protein